MCMHGVCVCVCVPSPSQFALRHHSAGQCGRETVRGQEVCGGAETDAGEWHTRQQGKHAGHTIIVFQHIRVVVHRYTFRLAACSPYSNNLSAVPRCRYYDLFIMLLYVEQYLL